MSRSFKSLLRQNALHFTIHIVYACPAILRPFPTPCDGFVSPASLPISKLMRKRQVGRLRHCPPFNLGPCSPHHSCYWTCHEDRASMPRYLPCRSPAQPRAILRIYPSIVMVKGTEYSLIAFITPKDMPPLPMMASDPLPIRGCRLERHRDSVRGQLGQKYGRDQDH